MKRVGRPKAGEGNPANSRVSYGTANAAYLAARLRPFVVDRLPAVGNRGGDRKSRGRDQTDNVSLNGHGNGEEYLLRRLKKHGEIKAAGNAKRAAAAKVRPRDDAGKLKARPVVDHNDPPLAKKHVAREARAAEARVSPATMARAEQIGQKRPVSGDGTSKTPNSP